MLSVRQNNKEGCNMTERKLIAIRLEPKHIQRLAEMGRKTGWTQSEVIRQLIEQAQVSPAEVTASIKKGTALVAA
jgi:predicted DNA-binding protein